MSGPDAPARVSARALLGLALPAAAVGVLSAIVLAGVTAVARALEGLLWDTLPDAAGVDPASAPWIVGTLTAAGLSVGLVVRYAPGHAGPDPATVGLAERPLPLGALPGLAVAAILTLGTGVSLGPESPVVAINASLVVWLGMRAMPRVLTPMWVVLGTAATIGALFGTPIAAALMLSEAGIGDRREPLWDRLFAPLVAATAGALTARQLFDLHLGVSLPPYVDLRLVDVGVVTALGLATAALGLLAAEVLPVLHRTAHRLRSPVLLLTAGGFVLGLLGVVGGPVTLFKGLDQMQELAGRIGTTSAAQFATIALVKLAAVLVATAVGFRGGRIFPATFVGVALGFAVNAAWPAIPLTVAVGGTTVGLLLAVTRSGWLSLFIVVVVTADTALLPALLLATLAAWLLVRAGRELRVTDDDAESPVRTEPTGPPPS